MIYAYITFIMRVFYTNRIYDPQWIVFEECVPESLWLEKKRKAVIVLTKCPEYWNLDFYKYFREQSWLKCITVWLQ